jgi:hypothetical protein
MLGREWLVSRENGKEDLLSWKGMTLKRQALN